MAKSIRSKRRRKMRAIKRVRYGEKELARLQKTLENDPTKKDIDVVMEDVKELVKVKSKKEMKKTDLPEESEEKMDDGTINRVFKKRSLRDQYGSYPVWMHQRKIKKGRKGRKRRLKAKAKKK